MARGRPRGRRNTGKCPSRRAEPAWKEQSPGFLREERAGHRHRTRGVGAARGWDSLGGGVPRHCGEVGAGSVGGELGALGVRARPTLCSCLAGTMLTPAASAGSTASGTMLPSGSTCQAQAPPSTPAGPVQRPLTPPPLPTWLGDCWGQRQGSRESPREQGRQVPDQPTGQVSPEAPSPLLQLAGDPAPTKAAEHPAPGRTLEAHGVPSGSVPDSG